MSNRPPDISSRPLSAAANSPPNSKPVKRPCSFFQNAASALPQKPPTQTDTVASGHAMDAEQPCLYEELQREVQKAVDALPDRCREVFRMSRFEGLKNREIAARLGISETAVEKHLARAVGRLGEHLRRSCSFELSVAVLSCLLANYL